MKDLLITVLSFFFIWLTILTFLLYRDYQADRQAKRELIEEFIDVANDLLLEYKLILR